MLNQFKSQTKSQKRQQKLPLAPTLSIYKRHSLLWLYPTDTHAKTHFYSAQCISFLKKECFGSFPWGQLVFLVKSLFPLSPANINYYKNQHSVVKHWVKVLSHFPLRVNLPLSSMFCSKINRIKVCVSEIKLTFTRDADGLTEALGWAEGGWTESWIMGSTQKHSVILSKHPKHPQHTDESELCWWFGMELFFCKQQSQKKTQYYKKLGWEKQNYKIIERVIKLTLIRNCK